MLIECILIGSSLCHTVNAKPVKAEGVRKQHAIVSMLKDRPVMMLMAADLTAKTMDYRQTERDFVLGGFRETNPVLRPMLGHSAAMYAYGAAYAFGAAWVGHKMHASRFTVVRKLWWLPQTISIEQNVWGYAYTRAHYRR
ncbi:MAG TPA: hypothetical protein VFB23_09035 [Candidatus Acidoferrales bacterium]|jgi:hypothetical protein|nr:hypothetical protein [Candidatus Acidoferrales bacterium]